jgi:hypothetical protein
VQKLLTDAQTLSDSLAIWRKPSPENSINLLLLSTLVGQGDITTYEAKSYLTSLVAQLQQMHKVKPALLHGEQNDSIKSIVWTTLVYDTFCAIERKETPILCAASSCLSR